jgi:hypothetical protein
MSDLEITRRAGMTQHEPRPVAPVSTPLDVRLIDGEIVVIGPGSIAFSMTLAAAKDTCERLRQALEAET